MSITTVATIAISYCYYYDDYCLAAVSLEIDVCMCTHTVLLLQLPHFVTIDLIVYVRVYSMNVNDCSASSGE